MGKIYKRIQPCVLANRSKMVTDLSFYNQYLGCSDKKILFELHIFEYASIVKNKNINEFMVIPNDDIADFMKNTYMLFKNAKINILDKRSV